MHYKFIRWEEEIEGCKEKESDKRCEWKKKNRKERYRKKMKKKGNTRKSEWLFNSFISTEK